MLSSRSSKDNLWQHWQSLGATAAFLLIQRHHTKLVQSYLLKHTVQRNRENSIKCQHIRRNTPSLPLHRKCQAWSAGTILFEGQTTCCRSRLWWRKTACGTFAGCWFMDNDAQAAPFDLTIATFRKQQLSCHWSRMIYWIYWFHNLLHKNRSLHFTAGKHGTEANKAYTTKPDTNRHTNKSRTHARTHTHTHTQSFNWPLSRTTWVSRYHKGTRSSAIAEWPRNASCQ